MHILLSVLGWTLLALLALLVLALVLPVRAEIEFREGSLSVRVRVFGLAFRAYPFPGSTRKRKPKKKKTEKKAAQDAASQKKKKKSSGLEIEDIGNILGAAGAFVRRMYRMIHITDTILIVPIHREDAAATALACGRAEAWLGSMAALLQNYFDLRIVQVRVLPDFTNEITAGVYLSCSIGARPIAFVAAGIHALFCLLRQMPAPASKRKPSAAKPQAQKRKPQAQKQKPQAPSAGR